MLLYLILFIIVFFFDSSLRKAPVKRQKTAIIFISILFALIFALRGVEVGTDNPNYYLRYNSAIVSLESIFSAKYWFLNEPLWEILVSLKNYDISYEVFNLIYITICLLLLYYIVKDTKFPIISFAMFFYCYYYFSCFNIMRQALAALLGLAFLCAISNKKNIWAILFLVAASLIHRSGVFLLLFFIISRINISRKIAYLAIAASVLFVSLGLDFQIFPFLDMSSLIDYYGAGTVKQFSSYLDERVSGLNIFGQISYWSLIILKVLLFILITNNTKGNLSSYHKFWLIGIVLIIVTSNFAWLFRLSIYFLLPSIVVIPNIFDNNRKQLNTIIYSIIFVIFIGSLYGNAEGVVPYYLNF